MTEQKDTNAWIAQVWISFAIAFTATCLGIYYLPVDGWIRGFMGMSMLFTVASTFTLAKTIRDNHEAQRLRNRLTEAKAEKIIRDFELKEVA
jgi:hypothetical protein